MFNRKNAIALLMGIPLALGTALPVQATDPTSKEGRAPSSVIKLTPTGSVSLRYVALNYGVSGGKIFLHEFQKSSATDDLHFVDIFTPNSKRLQRFQLAYPPNALGGTYKVHPLWLIPSQQKLAALHFEGVEAHLVVVFPAGFAKAGSQQFFSELEVEQKREVTFTELDRRGYRMVRVDVLGENAPTSKEKVPFKATYYYFWNGTKFAEKLR